MRIQWIDIKTTCISSFCRMNLCFPNYEIMIGANMITMRGNAFLQHVFIVIKHYIILISSSGVLMGQDRAEYDGQAKQGLQRPHYIYTLNCMGDARRLSFTACLISQRVYMWCLSNAQSSFEWVCLSGLYSQAFYIKGSKMQSTITYSQRSTGSAKPGRPKTRSI